MSERWVGLLRLQKRIGSPSFRLTLTHHAIYIKKTGPRGVCVRGVGKLASPSLHLTLMRQLIFIKAQVRETDMFSG